VTQLLFDQQTNYISF